jgi:hypothetical protein
MKSQRILQNGSRKQMDSDAQTGGAAASVEKFTEAEAAEFTEALVEEFTEVKRWVQELSHMKPVRTAHTLADKFARGGEINKLRKAIEMQIGDINTSLGKDQIDWENVEELTSTLPEKATQMEKAVEEAMAPILEISEAFYALTGKVNVAAAKVAAAKVAAAKAAETVAPAVGGARRRRKSSRKKKSRRKSSRKKVNDDEKPKRRSRRKSRRK